MLVLTNGLTGGCLQSALSAELLLYDRRGKSSTAACRGEAMDGFFRKR